MWHVYRREGDPHLNKQDDLGNGRGNGRPRPPPLDWAVKHKECQARLTPELRKELAVALHVPESSLAALPIGWTMYGPQQMGPCWTFPEVDATGKVIGLCCRDRAGHKKSWGNRGLHVPAGWDRPDTPLVIVEGATDTLAAAAMGLTAIGRPSNKGGVDHLVRLLEKVPAERPVIVVGENDGRPDTGEWPGKDGAVHVASELSRRLGRDIPWSLPAPGAKDVRAFCSTLDLTCGDQWSEAGEKFLAWVTGHPHTVKPVSPTTAPEQNPADDKPEITAADVAGIDDLVRAGAELKWVWPGWIQLGVLNLVLADVGVGKTRFVADLARRVRHGLPWPDGKEMTWPADAKVMWVVADLHHAELTKVCTEFDIMDTVKVNACKSDPFAGTSLDMQEDLDSLEARIRAVQPLLVVVDTVNGSTAKNICRPEEAILFFGPLQAIAQRCGTTFLLLHHTNLSGGAIGRRVMERVRSALRIEDPDPEGQPKRRRLEVFKSNSLRPPALGITMGDHGNEYDTNPPSKPDKEPGRRAGPPPTKTMLCMRWLRAYLWDTPKRVKDVIEAAQKDGHITGTLYKAKNRMPVEEYTDEEKRKWWKLITEVVNKQGPDGEELDPEPPPEFDEFTVQNTIPFPEL
jgi:hypothetical protein